MQIPLRWINELVDIETIPLDSLIEKLTLGGFEVEEILEIENKGKKQIALDISATANRSDSLSIQGISMEISALLNKPIKLNSYKPEILKWKKTVERIALPSPIENYCSTFLAFTIENIKDITVPEWIKEKLISSGFTPVNNLLDFQTYILLETGYPFSFYDFEKISSKFNNSDIIFSIDNVRNNQEFLASNDIRYKLNNSNVIVNANKIPIGIAGLIESKEFSYSEQTTSLLIEASIFNAAKIRQQSRDLGLRTERSARYEKSLKNTYLIESLYRLISLLRVKNPTLICKIKTALQPNQKSSNSLLLRYQTINEILGPIKDVTKNKINYISPEIITSYLYRLNFEFSYNNSELIWEVKVPDLRSDDIIREIDLIEEIGRLHGFNNFLTTLPKIVTIGKEDLSYKTRKKITSSLLNLGFNELIHYSLVSEQTYLKNNVKLINPLISDYSHLRSSLLPDLLRTVEENVKQGNMLVEGFEYGHIFSSDNLKNFKEIEYVSGIFGGIKKKLSWTESVKGISWFEAKGKIEQLFKQLNLIVYWKTNLDSKNSEMLHPYRSAKLYCINGEKLGTFGQIHPILANQLTLVPETYLFEFNLQTIETQLQQNTLTMYNEYSSYPKIIKDLSFIIKQDVSFSEVEKLLKLNGTQFLSEVNLLDEYRGKSIPDQYTSLCLQLVFQSNQKTLKNKEIDNIINNLQALLTNKFEAILRE